MRQTGGKLVLGSATPSIDSFEAAQEGRYNLIVMDRRISGRGMPPIEIVDMSKELLAGNADIFSRRLMQEMDGALSRGEQVMLFPQHRRGHSSFAMCRNCGYVPKCENCDVALSYHSVEKALVCHYCGARYKMITRCPKCGSDNIKMGKIGTQRVVSELQKMHPGTKILRLDAESTTTKDAYLDILGAFKAREAQILVGTQMIAKGHDFPDVTLVGNPRRRSRALPQRLPQCGAHLPAGHSGRRQGGKSGQGGQGAAPNLFAVALCLSLCVAL